RTAILPDYKAHRITDPVRGTETPAELEAQLPVIFDALDALGIPIAEVPGTEADDVIASIVAQSPDEDLVVVSSDRDLLALLMPGRRLRIHRPRT
ncbi:5'-3' exonuclease, partial [Mycoplasma flocculare]|nr:5'-3' exonuclease [Mesomycoplasma flocculare]